LEKNELYNKIKSLNVFIFITNGGKITTMKCFVIKVNRKITKKIKV